MSQSTRREAAEDILGKIAGLLDNDSLTCHAVFVSRKKVAAKTGHTGGRRHDFDLVGMNLRRRAYDEIVSRYKKFVKERSDWHPILLEAGDDGGEPPERSYYVESTKKVPFYKDYLAKPRGGKEEKFDKKFTSKIAAMEFRFEGDGIEAVFIKRFRPGRVFKHKKRTMFKLMGGDIDVEADDVVDLPWDCDCCVFGGHTLIFYRAQYENIFDHHARYEAIHKRVFEHFRKKSDYEIVDIDKLEKQTLNDSAKLRRFPAIVKRGIWKMKFRKIRKFLKGRTITSVTATTDPNQIAFKDSRAMMHFLNDAHLDSKATSKTYLASNKTEE